MLKEQHIPWSVGKVVKIEEQGIDMVFQEQYFRMDFSPSTSEVIPFLSKQGNVEYCKDANIIGRTGVNYINILCTNFLYESKLSSFSLVTLAL